MEGLPQEAGYMTASVPKRVVSFESPLTARAGPYMYLSPADNSPRLNWGVLILCQAQKQPPCYTLLLGVFARTFFMWLMNNWIPLCRSPLDNPLNTHMSACRISQHYSVLARLLWNASLTVSSALIRPS